MENLNLDTQTLIIIASSILLVLVVLVILVRKRKKKGGKKDVKHVDQKVEGKKYQGSDPSEEEIESAPRLVLEKFDDGAKSISFRFKVKGPKIKLDEIDPYDNSWIRIVDYNGLVGQVRSEGDLLHVYMERKDRYRPSRQEKALISIVYRQDGGKQWLQQIKYNSNTGATMGALKILN